MKHLLATAALAALITASGAHAQASQAPTAVAPSVRVSPKAQPAIIELQKAVTANDRAKIPGALAAAQAAAQTSDDRWMIAGLQMRAALAVKDYAGMSAALDAIVASGHIEPAKAAENYKTIGSEQYNVKDYAGAAAQFGKAVKLQPGDAEGLKLLGESLLLGGKSGEAVPIMQRAIDASASAGVKADEQLYRVAVQAAFDSKSPATSELAQKWLAAYPSADSWRNTLLIYRNANPSDDLGDLALYRLMNATGGLKSANDYGPYVRELLDQSNFNEAHAVVEQALAANAIEASSADAKSVASKPTASATDLAAAAKTAQSGMALLKIGDRFYGSGEYAKAAELYRQAKTKGVDAGTADLYTGVALARTGDRAAAKAALTSVSGSRAGIAKYWLLYLDQAH